MKYQDLLAEVALNGTYEGRTAKLFHIMGRRSQWTNNTDLHDIAEHLGASQLLVELDGTESFELVSTSANDAAAGTGTRTVDIVYMDANYALASITKTLNGVGVVAVGVLGAKALLWMEAATGGSSQVSAGDIKLRLTGAGATNLQITAGGNKSLSAFFMVPDGYEVIMPCWDTHAIRQPQDCRLRATVKTLDRSLGTRYLFQDTAYMGTDMNAEHDMHLVKFPARSKIKVSAVSTSVAGTPRCDVSFVVILIQGD